MNNSSIRFLSIYREPTIFLTAITNLSTSSRVLYIAKVGRTLIS